LPTRSDLEALDLDDLIAVAMDAHFALWGRGHDVVRARLREQRDQLIAEADRHQAALCVAKARIEELKAELPRLVRQQRWLEGPEWARREECANAKAAD
jgi:hypothetical protein